MADETDTNPGGMADPYNGMMIVKVEISYMPPGGKSWPDRRILTVKGHIDNRNLSTGTLATTLNILKSEIIECWHEAIAE
jgi:hypothetical protein